MISFGPTFIWTAFNLLILYFVMRRILFKPITLFMNKRSESIRSAIEDADKNKAESMELKKEYECLLRNARAEADRILEAARAEAGREYENIMFTAGKDAEDILVKAREEIEYEKARALNAVKNKVAELALLAASKVIEENMDNETNRIIVNKFIDEAGAYNASD